MLLSGTVTADVVGGNLFIKGDNGGNQIVLDQAGLLPGQVRISGASGTQVSTDTIALADSAILEGVTGNVTIRTGSGDDSVSLDGPTVAGRVLINTGKGDNTILVDGTNVGKTLTILNGPDDDQTMIIDSTILGKTLVKSASGNDGVTMQNNTIGGDLAIAAGHDDDLVTLDDLQVAGKLLLNTGRGADTVNVERSPVAGGPQSYFAGGNIRLGTGTDILHIGVAGEIGHQANFASTPTVHAGWQDHIGTTSTDFKVFRGSSRMQPGPVNVGGTYGGTIQGGTTSLQKITGGTISGECGAFTVSGSSGIVDSITVAPLSGSLVLNAPVTGGSLAVFSQGSVPPLSVGTLTLSAVTPMTLTINSGTVTITYPASSSSPETSDALTASAADPIHITHDLASGTVTFTSSLRTIIVTPPATFTLTTTSGTVLPLTFHSPAVNQTVTGGLLTTFAPGSVLPVSSGTLSLSGTATNADSIDAASGAIYLSNGTFPLNGTSTDTGNWEVIRLINPTSPTGSLVFTNPTRRIVAGDGTVVGGLLTILPPESSVTPGTIPSGSGTSTGTLSIHGSEVVLVGYPATSFGSEIPTGTLTTSGSSGLSLGDAIPVTGTLTLGTGTLTLGGAITGSAGSLYPGLTGGSIAFDPAIFKGTFAGGSLTTFAPGSVPPVSSGTLSLSGIPA